MTKINETNASRLPSGCFSNPSYFPEDHKINQRVLEKSNRFIPLYTYASKKDMMVYVKIKDIIKFFVCVETGIYIKGLTEEGLYLLNRDSFKTKKAAEEALTKFMEKHCLI